MLINIVDVGAPNTHAAKNGRSYQSIEVTYKNDQGQVANKKLMSFSNPTVFNHIKGLGKGDQINVQTTKDANGYWQWTGIGGDSEATQEAKPATASPGGRVTGSNYETKEERAQRQRYIVRQSSIASAIEFFNQGQSTQNVDDIIRVAKEFEDYVFSQATGIDALNSMEDDIPV